MQVEAGRTVADARWAVEKLVQEKSQNDKAAWRKEFLGKTA